MGWRELAFNKRGELRLFGPIVLLTVLVVPSILLTGLLDVPLGYFVVLAIVLAFALDRFRRLLRW